ncbi:hypothetical protein G7Z17_g11204 [Cylindrodendrum hubeiense]|uniref:Uncharacterized protein n=1 Tax=Cylindrodendrum hubeiense TaxID=595255 RepID=A0A9P5LAG9_9HYPO|nr:hypothetical protein G7Z17_g11204 [Cylindrodendrum hubeiense]
MYLEQNGDEAKPGSRDEIAHTGEGKGVEGSVESGDDGEGHCWWRSVARRDAALGEGLGMAWGWTGEGADVDADVGKADVGKADAGKAYVRWRVAYAVTVTGFKLLGVTRAGGA